MLGALKQARQDRQRQNPNAMNTKNDPINFVLVSTDPVAFEEFETPFGEFTGLKRQGEQMMFDDFPSLTSVALQMGLYDDNFLDEGREIVVQKGEKTSADSSMVNENGNKRAEQRRINRRDAAKAVVDALTDESLVGKTAQVWTYQKIY